MDEKTKIAVSIFNENAKTYLEKFSDQSLYIEALDFFLSQLPKSDSKILDLACGPGSTAKHLLSKNSDLNIFGIDLAENMIKMAKELCGAAQFMQLDCRDFKSLGKTFDGIICSFTFPYLNKKDVSQLIQDVSESLNETGIVYISTMEGKYETSGYRPSSSGKGPEAFIHYYSKEFLINELNRLGLECIYEQLKDYPEDNPSATKDLILVAKKLRSN